MRYLSGMILAVLLLFAVGCGQRKDVVPTSLRSGERTREMKIGDRMTYDIVVTGFSAQGKRLGAAQGKVKLQVRKGFKQGAVPAGIEKTFNVTEQLEVGSGPSGQITWEGQDADGAIYFLGRLDEGKEWALVTDKKPMLDVPAVLEEGKSWKYTMRLSDGKTETDSYKIEKIDKVRVPAGEFEAYKTKVTVTVSDGRLATGYAWLRPELPRPIKTQIDIQNTKRGKGRTNHIEQVLNSYKFAKQ